jgi:PTS system cellobiose-specific IIB component
MILCHWGATSSVLCKKVQDAATKKGISLDAEAAGITQFRNKARDLDLVLLEPQVRHLQKEIESITRKHQIPLQLVDSISFATMNGDQVLKQVLQSLPLERVRKAQF